MRKALIVVIYILFLTSLTPVAAREAAGSHINPLAALAISWVFDLTDLEAITGGFVTKTPEGICAIEKRFMKDRVELRLQGMAHVAGQDFYRKIKESLKNEKAIILMEGVTDDNDLLETPPDYGAIADNLGLTSQRDHFSPHEMPETVEVIRADLDTSDFSPQTVELLNFVGKVYSKKGIDFANLMLMYLQLSDIERSRIIMRDLISRRNQCLIDHINENLTKTSIVVVPWGAMHLPQIELWARKEGFELKKTSSYLVVAFPEYFKFILRPAKKKSIDARTQEKSLSELLGI